MALLQFPDTSVEIRQPSSILKGSLVPSILGSEVMPHRDLLLFVNAKRDDNLMLDFRSLISSSRPQGPLFLSSFSPVPKLQLEWSAAAVAAAPQSTSPAFFLSRKIIIKGWKNGNKLSLLQLNQHLMIWLHCGQRQRVE
ncbi:PREDICTED: uncharacterized protein LOC109216283 [Nicotiana attenuata]|uniref:uncharacterized protein LOC109216283 n=1 Tax=Nicotiana attenuata TaxID=49451 RepID=UPI0009059034|nr:PREDICTED: uncharacterized protein LOC109216283 [Nicotiana attenuata]